MRHALKQVHSRMETAMRTSLKDRRQQLERLTPRLDAWAASRLMDSRHRLERAVLRMQTAGPMETMKRGYAILSRDGAVVRSTAALKPGDRLTVRLADGRVQTLVQSVQPDERQEG